MLKGLRQNFHARKLPVGYAQVDENGSTEQRGLWTPRQGLSRPSNIVQMDGAITSMGNPKVGVYKGLVQCDDTGDVQGYALGVTPINPDWEAPVSFEPVTDVTIDIYIDSPNVVIEWTEPSNPDYVNYYEIWLDGEVVGTTTDDTFTDENPTGNYDYEVTAVYNTGTSPLVTGPYGGIDQFNAGNYLNWTLGTYTAIGGGYMYKNYPYRDISASFPDFTTGDSNDWIAYISFFWSVPQKPNLVEFFVRPSVGASPIYRAWINYSVTPTAAYFSRGTYYLYGSDPTSGRLTIRCTPVDTLNCYIYATGPGEVPLGGSVVSKSAVHNLSVMLRTDDDALVGTKIVSCALFIND
jgi:hypothetical protein